MNKLIFQLLCLVLALSAGAQNYVPSPWTKTASPVTARAALGIYETNAAAYNVTNTIYLTNSYTVTNWGALAVNTIFVDAVSGDDTTGTGSPVAPVISLGRAQELATNGDTIYVARGTFTETYLGKPGVSWHLADGVLISGVPSFDVGTNNGTTNLVVTGRGTFTNYAVYFRDATNATASITGKAWIGGGAAVHFDHGNSNTAFLNFDTFYGTTLCGFLAEGTAVYSNRSSKIFLTAEQSIYGAPTAGTTSGNTNCLVTLKAPEVFSRANYFGISGCRVALDGGRFSRNGIALNSVNTNQYLFKGVTIRTTNDLNTGVLPVRGTIYVEIP